jgi:hypothetical protein
MYEECRHIMPNGAHCHSPAMRGLAWCYFHVPGRRSSQNRSQARSRPLKLPPLVNRRAVQTALVQVLNAIGPRKISQKSAGQMLFGIRMALDNIRDGAGRPNPKEQGAHRGTPDFSR